MKRPKEKQKEGKNTKQKLTVLAVALHRPGTRRICLPLTPHPLKNLSALFFYSEL
jgi:hypothetical protein